VISSSRLKERDWSDVEFTHDGISCGKIIVSGSLDGIRYNMVGSVPSVGQRGIDIGSWQATAPFKLPFPGNMGELKLWRHDDKDMVKNLISYISNGFDITKGKNKIQIKWNRSNGIITR
jgi:hypothetical protein